MLLLTIRIIWKYIFSSVVAGFLDRQFVICGTPLMSTHPQSVLCIFVPFPLTGISINQEKNAKNKSIFADSTLSVNHLIMIILWTTTRQQEWSRQPGSVLLLYPLFRYSWAGMQHPSTCRYGEPPKRIPLLWDKSWRVGRSPKSRITEEKFYLINQINTVPNHIKSGFFFGRLPQQLLHS